MTYGQRLKKTMATAKKSRKELALTLGCTVQAIGMVITGGGKLERGLSAENNVKAARYLRVDSYWLATGEGEMTLKTPLRITEKLSEDALEIAAYFDKLQDPGDRTLAYVAAMSEILKVLSVREKKNTVTPI